VEAMGSTAVQQLMTAIARVRSSREGVALSVFSVVLVDVLGPSACVVWLSGHLLMVPCR
jgi:hypothetical protein